MKIIEPGHIYALNWVDGLPHHPRENYLIFVKREGEKYPGNIGHHPGTQIQEVCRALIDRLRYVDQQEHHQANGAAVDHLRRVITVLEERAAERHGRAFHAWQVTEIETLPTCQKCGHVECEGDCH